MGKYAILIVSALIFSLLTYSQALRNALFISNVRVVESYSQNQAHNIANSAAMMVVRDLRASSNSVFNPGNSDFWEFPNDGTFHDWPEMHGSYRIQITKQADPNRIFINSIGRFEDTEYRTTIGLQAGTFNPVFDQALHAENSISLSGNDEIGCEGLSPCQVTLNSTSSNSISLSGSSEMNASLFIGPGGDPNVVLSSGSLDKISDPDVGILEEEISFPPPIFPNFNEIFDSSPSPLGNYTSSTTFNPEDFNNKYFDSIVLGGQSSITFNTGSVSTDTLRLRVRNLILAGQSNIQLNGEGVLQLYVDQEVDMRGGSAVNEGGNVSKLTLFYQGFEDLDLVDPEQMDLELGGNTIFNGSLHADQAKVVMRGTSGIQGNVLSNGNVEMWGNAEAISRLIYTPQGNVYTQGNTKIRGAVVANNFSGSGNTSLIFDPDLDADIPNFQGQIFNIAFWN